MIIAKIVCFAFLHITISNSGIHFEHASIFSDKTQEITLLLDCMVYAKNEELIQACQT